MTGENRRRRETRKKIPGAHEELEIHPRSRNKRRIEDPDSSFREDATCRPAEGMVRKSSTEQIANVGTQYSANMSTSKNVTDSHIDKMTSQQKEEHSVQKQTFGFDYNAYTDVEPNPSSHIYEQYFHEQHHLGLDQSFSGLQESALLSSMPPYISGTNFTYTGMLEEIISSQEERRLQQQFQENICSYTDLLLGKTNIIDTEIATERNHNEINDSALFQADPSTDFMVEGDYMVASEAEETNSEINAYMTTNNEVETDYMEHHQTHETNTGRNTNISKNNEITVWNGGFNEGLHEDGEDEPNWQIQIFDEMQLEQVNNNADQEREEYVQQTESTNISSPEHQVMQSLAISSSDTNEHPNEELTEEDVELFLQEEQRAASEGNNASLDSKYTPKMGQEFNSKEDAQHFFNYYAFIAGFQVVITHSERTTSKKRNNEVYKIEMKCKKYGKEGQRQKNNSEEEIGNPIKDKRKTNVTIRTNCQVVMVVKETNGIWKITRLDLDHNHPLSPGSRTQLFSGHKYMTNMEKGLIRTLNSNNIKTRSMIAILSFLRGNVTVTPYDKKAVSNYRTKINREVSSTDLSQALEYFRKKKSQDPTFFYRFDLDETKKVRNMFWADATSVQYYAEYGDLVSFDTTFLTNRYNLPFAPFVGITGHGQTCIFGCAFLVDETIETFKWLFETFLEAMGGKHPKTIITDQDGAMKSAIEIVFPNTIHRNCIFHIKRKCYEVNGKCFAVNDGLDKQFEDIINNSITTVEFELLWKEMIEKKKLQDNKYFTKMYEIRERFIPVYFKENFCPFLHSTARSESTNSRFKDNVGPTYSIISFIREYERIIDTINTTEAYEDSISREKRPKELDTEYYLEEQGMNLYNRNIFRKFQKEIKATTSLSYAEKVYKKEYEVYQKPNHSRKEYRKRTYLVYTDFDREEYSCICCKFQKDGILCAHILKVMIEEDVMQIPDKYIIDRWRKKDKKMLPIVPVDSAGTHELLRFNALSRLGAEISSKGASNSSTFEYLMDEYKRINNQLDMILANEANPEEENDVQLEGLQLLASTSNTNSSEEDYEIQNPDRIKQKGRPKLPKRFKTKVEELKEKLAKKEMLEKKKAESKSKKANTNHTGVEGKSRKRKKNSEKETRVVEGR
ncbi:hypothetical protein ACP70R_018549 [Stipagrostis hirtigluma subsp. patula]